MRAPVVSLFLITALAPALGQAAPALPAPVKLAEGFTLQTSAKVSEKGDVLSTPAYKPRGWHDVTVPTTVVAALVKSKVFPDPFFGMNIRKLPGMDYEVATNFSNFAMKKDNPFAVPWWYRKEFTLPAGYKGKTVWLTFNGINYRANVWLNGQRVADSDQIQGSWRIYHLNVTDHVKAGGRNVLAVETFAQTETDLGITFVDWNPTPPDKNLGLWRDVVVSATGPVAVRYPTVITRLAPANDNAFLTVTALLENGSKQPVTGTLKGRIGKRTFAKSVTLAPGEKKEADFTPAEFAVLKVENPELWWPAQMGKPNLHQLDVEFVVGKAVSDRDTSTFGIREVKSELDANKSRVFYVNGKRILIRGAGWSSDMMMREDPERVADELRYVKDMGLNTVRLEGKLESESFLDYTDKHGLLVMAGWCCCDHWEDWAKWKDVDHKISAEQTRDQLYRLRSRASLFVWLNSSDNPPPSKVEQRYLDVARDVRWPHPILSSASAKPAPLTGVTGVKMLGPYEWVPPKYWYEDSKNGGAFGFNSETSAGPAPPPVETLKKMLPPDKLWPINEYWDFHAGGQEFKQIDIFKKALDERYGASPTVEDFAMKSQLMTYEATRAMFEAFSRNKYKSTGVIQWMLNNAWPGIIWHLYDWYLRPGGGYFGTKVAMQPLNPIYSYDDGSIWLINSSYRDASGLTVTAKVYDLGMVEKHTQSATLDIPADGNKKAFDLPYIEGLSKAHFVHLTVTDGKGARVGSNFYWLSTERETLAYDKSKWFVTPTRNYADFKDLAKLPKVSVSASDRTRRVRDDEGEWSETEVTLSNPSKSLAFFIRLKLNARGEEVLPVRWEDNYLSLLPGEKRTVTARVKASDLRGAQPSVEISGYNLK